MYVERASALKARMDTAAMALGLLQGARDQSINEAKSLKVRLDDAKAEELLLTKTAAVLAEIQKKADAAGHRTVEKMVNQALDMVFGGEHDFVFLQETKRGVTSTTPCLRAPNGTLAPIYDARGGGLEDVVSFVLQLLAMFRATPSLRRFMILDEPFAALAVAQTPAMADFLRLVTDQFGMTILMVTHGSEWSRVADRAYKAVRLTPGHTTFIEVTGK